MNTTTLLRTVIVSAGLLANSLLQAATYTWTGAVSSDWNNPANWNPNTGVPGDGDSAVINSGSPTIAEATTVAAISLMGGSLGGSGVLTVTNVMDWTGGTMGGSGATVIAAGATLNIKGDAEKKLNQRSVRNLGTVVWSGAGNIFVQNGAPFWNEAGGVFEVQNDAVYQKDPWSAAGTFYNLGTLRKVGAGGTTTWSGVGFENGGTVETLSGRFLFPSGVSSSGSFLVGAGATNVFNGTCWFESGSVLGGAGQNRFEEITATLDGAIAATNLVMASGSWRGTNVVSGSWAWTGGTLSGPGGTTLAEGGRWDITGPGEKVLNSRSVRNLGTVVWSGAGRIFVQNGAPFWNEADGVFEVQNDAVYQKDPWSAAGAFHNAGVFRKTGGAGTTTFDGIPFHSTGTVELASGTLAVTDAFNNDGLVQVEGGTLVLSGGGTSGGRMEVDQDQVVRITGGTHTLGEGSGWVGAGNIQISGGTVNVAGAAGVERLALSGGTLGGSGVLTVTNVMDWTGGTMGGSGATVIAAGATLNVKGDGQKTLDRRSVRNLWTVVWSGAGNIFVQNGAPFWNEADGVFEVQNDAVYQKDPWSAAGTFYNLGTLRKVGAGGTTTWSGVGFENGGTVETLSGRFLFPNGVSSSGSFLAGAGATNVFNGTCWFESGSVLGGAGQNRFEEITATLEGAIAATNLVMASGSWRGTNVVSGSWAWTGGTLSGPGGTTLAEGGRWDITGAGEKVLNSRSVTNLGTVVWSGAGRIFVQNGAPFWNEASGVFEVQNDAVYQKDPWSAAGAFHNAGVFRKTGGGGTTTVDDISFHNTGTVELADGTLAVSGAFNNDGLVQVEGGTLVLSGGGTSGGRMEVDQDQVVRITGGTHTLGEGSGWVGAGNIQISGGTVNVAGAAGVERLALSGGTLGGSGVLTVTNVMDWTGGTMGGSGATVIAAGATLNIKGDGQKALDRRSVTVRNLGTVVWSGAGNIFVQNGAPFWNEADGVFEVQNDAVYQKDPWSAAGTFYNLGTLRKVGAGGTTTWSGVGFENGGTVETLSGRFLFPNGVSSSGSFLAGAGATNVFNGTCWFESGSVLGGAGQNRFEEITATLEGAIAATNLVMASGSWRGTNVVSGSWAWTGGTLSGPGGTTLAEGGRWDITGAGEKVLNSRSVTNLGTVVWSGAGRIFVQNGAPFWNEASGVFEVQNDAVYQKDPWSAAGAFHNAGVFRKTGGAGTTTIDGILFNNTGTLGVLRGTLTFDAALDLAPTTTIEIGLEGAPETANYGRIASGQALQLMGHLAVRFVDGFIPGPDEDYQVIVAPIRGEFQSYSVPDIASEIFMNPVYLANGLWLATIDAVPVLLGGGAIDSEGRFTLGIQGAVNQRYAVEASTDFLEWTVLEIGAIPASTVWRFVDEDVAVFPHRFYRVKFEP